MEPYFFIGGFHAITTLNSILNCFPNHENMLLAKSKKYSETIAHLSFIHVCSIPNTDCIHVPTIRLSSFYFTHDMVLLTDIVSTSEMSGMKFEIKPLIGYCQSKGNVSHTSWYHMALCTCPWSGDGRNLAVTCVIV